MIFSHQFNISHEAVLNSVITDGAKAYEVIGTSALKGYTIKFLFTNMDFQMLMDRLEMLQKVLTLC